ncbi:hypothetical protein [Sphingomonas sp. CFBP9021]|uniref:hypothetical protein n=1 Tax=Sphingomonas sp. CFBP9021 TaxID=3096534 RepID=UPI002A6AC620|nr:hypothetical protein [Sphingomonas sp. CFBP9021]MDY0966411.1 hypothetical protein [Sphingomonas sp. CFBP9021]
MNLVAAEIARFLASADPAVLCIRGRWGVGKTFAWKRHLADAIAGHQLAMLGYSYVSLFGLNSLEDLRFAVFENTVDRDHAVTGADADTFQTLLAKGISSGRKARPLLEILLPFFKGQGVASAIYRSAFLFVRDQLVCLDDLERAGPGLAIRDVLGLASFLKEERRCKVVLLLNDERLGDEAAEFADQIEKVADLTLLFAPTATEAATIALCKSDDLSRLLHERSVSLGITNIRVIAKAARLAQRLAELLNGHDTSIVDQAVTTLVLASWAVQQPSFAPPLSFLREYNSVAYFMRLQDGQPDADEQRWQAAIGDYPFSHADDLDRIVIEGAVAGYFHEAQLAAAAAEAQERHRQKQGDSEFSRVWQDMYHGSLATGDDEFLDALRDASIAEARWISPLNINSAIRLLRENGRGIEADTLVREYVTAHDRERSEFFDMGSHHFSREDRLDDVLRDAFAERAARQVDAREPMDVLRALGVRRGWDRSDILVMARCSADDFERMFEALSGAVMKPAIQTLLQIGRLGDDSAEGITEAAVAALRRIAAKSPLRARRVATLGVDLQDPAAPDD